MAWPTRDEVRSWGAEARASGNTVAIDLFEQWEASLPYPSLDDTYLSDALAVRSALGYAVTGWGSEGKRRQQQAEARAVAQRARRSDAGRARRQTRRARSDISKAQAAGRQAARRTLARTGSKTQAANRKERARKSSLARSAPRNSRGQFEAAK